MGCCSGSTEAWCDICEDLLQNELGPWDGGQLTPNPQLFSTSSPICRPLILSENSAQPITSGVKFITVWEWTR